jgi:hypothetical protein
VTGRSTLRASLCALAMNASGSLMIMMMTLKAHHHFNGDYNHYRYCYHSHAAAHCDSLLPCASRGVCVRAAASGRSPRAWQQNIQAERAATVAPACEGLPQASPGRGRARRHPHSSRCLTSSLSVNMHDGGGGARASNAKIDSPPNDCRLGGRPGRTSAPAHGRPPRAAADASAL